MTVLVTTCNAPINVLPQVPPHGQRWGFDLYEINSLSPWSKCYDQMPPLRLYIFTLLFVIIDQIPLTQGMSIGQMRSNPHLLPVGG